MELAAGHDNEVRDCDLLDLGRGAIHITGGGVAQPNTVENCYIHHIGKIDHVANAIFMEGQGYRIRHNLFHDLPGWAVFHTGNHHEITDNRVHHYMLETEDGAAFYTCNANGGIHPLVMKNCGLYVNAFRPKIPKEADGCANHPEWIKNPTDHINPKFGS